MVRIMWIYLNRITLFSSVEIDTKPKHTFPFVVIVVLHNKHQICKAPDNKSVSAFQFLSLSFSKLETEARDLLITRAEEYFNIPIRKKSGAK